MSDPKRFRRDSFGPWGDPKKKYLYYCPQMKELATSIAAQVGNGGKSWGVGKDGERIVSNDPAKLSRITQRPLCVCACVAVNHPPVASPPSTPPSTSPTRLLLTRLKNKKTKPNFLSWRRVLGLRL